MLRFTHVRSMVAAAVCGAAVIGVAGLAATSSASAQAVSPGRGQQTQTRISATTPDTPNGTYSLTDRCGGVNGHVVWNGDQVQIYGETWENPASCGGSGQHSVWLSFNYEELVFPIVYTEYFNHGYGYANPGTTVPFNSGVITTSTGYDVAGIKVTLCSSEGGWHCGPSKSF